MSSQMKRQTAPVPTGPRIEILDTADKPLMVMPVGPALKQDLRHKTVMVCLRNTRGHLFMRKCPAGGDIAYSGLWNVAASGIVLAEEACRDTAARLLREETGISGLECTQIDRLPPSPLTGNTVTAVFMTGKTSAIPRLESSDIQEAMYVDREELLAFLRDYPHMATPFLRLAAQYM